MVDIESEVHKLKRALAHIRQQKEGCEQKHLLISKERILKACEGQEDLTHIPKILSDACDDQNVPVAQEVFLNMGLQSRLRELGYNRDANALSIFGEAHCAMNMPQLNHKDRNRRLNKFRKLIRKLFGSAFNSVARISSGNKVFGFPRDLLLAFLSNIDAREHLLRLHPTIGSR